MLEVTRDNEIVWEFRNPTLLTYKGKIYSSAISGFVYRVPKDFVKFELSKPIDKGLLYSNPPELE